MQGPRIQHRHTPIQYANTSAMYNISSTVQTYNTCSSLNGTGDGYCTEVRIDLPYSRVLSHHVRSEDLRTRRVAARFDGGGFVVPVAFRQR